MIASNVSRAVLETAAKAVGVHAEITALSQSGLRHRVKLYPIVPIGAWQVGGRRWKDERGDSRYQRIRRSGVGRAHAVCWHGFRDFFRSVFRHAPNAIFRTTLDTWRGSEDFEARFLASGHKSIGLQSAPLPWMEACRCGEGYAG